METEKIELHVALKLLELPKEEHETIISILSDMGVNCLQDLNPYTFGHEWNPAILFLGADLLEQRGITHMHGLTLLQAAAARWPIQCWKDSDWGVIDQGCQDSKRKARAALAQFLQKYDEGDLPTEVANNMRSALGWMDECASPSYAAHALRCQSSAVMSGKKEAAYHTDLKQAGANIRDHLVWRLTEISPLQSRDQFLENLNTCLKLWPEDLQKNIRDHCLKAHATVVRNKLPHTFFSNAQVEAFRRNGVRPARARRNPQAASTAEALPIRPPPGLELPDGRSSPHGRTISQI